MNRLYIGGVAVEQAVAERFQSQADHIADVHEHGEAYAAGYYQ